MKFPLEEGYYFPAEWYQHKATWLSWPHKEASWPGKIDTIYPVYAQFIAKVAEGEEVHINVADANMEVRETKATPNKPSKPYVRLTIGGINYAQGLDNLIIAYAKATEKTFSEGEEVELPLDAVVKLTPNGAQFRVN